MYRIFTCVVEGKFHCEIECTGLRAEYPRRKIPGIHVRATEVNWTQLAEMS